MIIRFATPSDTIHIIRSLQNKKIEYNTVKQAKNDIEQNRLLIAIIDDKIVGSVAIVPELIYSYTVLKRLCVYNKKYRGKGIANQLIITAMSLTSGPVGATPWANNSTTIHLLEKNGFIYQYTFLEKYQFYLKNS